MATLIVLSIVSWVAAIVLTVTILRIRLRLRPETRQAFKQLAKAYIGVVLLIQATALIGGHLGLILPGWFYACIFVGILGPWVIALGVAGDLFGIQRAAEEAAAESAAK
jgi:cadmium resistance protein CadD (predicted permease)